MSADKKDITSWASKDGQFRRQQSTFRDQVGSERFPAEKGRYYLYVSLGKGNCAAPLAQREGG